MENTSLPRGYFAALQLRIQRAMDRLRTGGSEEALPIYVLTPQALPLELPIVIINRDKGGITGIERKAPPPFSRDSRRKRA